MVCEAIFDRQNGYFRDLPTLFYALHGDIVKWRFVRKNRRFVCYLFFSSYLCPP